MQHVIAVDWSGALKRVERKLWSAEVIDGKLVDLIAWSTREALVENLLEAGERDPSLVVGIDFAFSVPTWFAREHGQADARGLWRYVADLGESWLAECPKPFFGRAKSTRIPEDPARPLLRRTEEDLIRRGLGRPKSVFQIGGPGAVGTGSLRGMPFLPRFEAAGWRLWPFTDGDGPTVFEAWPRLYTPGLVKSAPGARSRFVEEQFKNAAPGHRVLARGSDDALDAAATAMGIADAMDEGRRLDEDLDATDRLEGRIATLRPREVKKPLSERFEPPKHRRNLDLATRRRLAECDLGYDPDLERLSQLL